MGNHSLYGRSIQVNGGSDKRSGACQGYPCSQQRFPVYSLDIPYIPFSQQKFPMNNGEPFGATNGVSQPLTSTAAVAPEGILGPKGGGRSGGVWEGWNFRTEVGFAAPFY